MTNSTDKNDAANALPGSWWITPIGADLVWVLTDDSDDAPWRTFGPTGIFDGWRRHDEAQAAGLVPLAPFPRDADSDDVPLLRLAADMLEAVGIAEDADYDATITRLRSRANRVAQDNDPDYQLAVKIAEEWSAQEAMNMLLDAIRRAKAGA